MSPNDKPTRKQLAYLRSLASQRGQTFQYPITKQEASREIERLLKGEPDSRLERAIERREGYEITAESLDATRVRQDETSGWGSSARWGS